MDYRKIQNGWVNDDVIAPQIIKTLDSTDGADFTFGITVQSHGKYDVDTGDYEQKNKGFGSTGRDGKPI